MDVVLWLLVLSISLYTIYVSIDNMNMFVETRYRIWRKFNNSKLGSWYYNMIYGIKNLITYFPLIWKTRDWDYYYIYEFLYYKIKVHRENLAKNNRHVGVEKNIHRMKTCELLLKRLMEDDYAYLDIVHRDGEYGKGSYFEYKTVIKEFKDREIDTLFKLEQSRRQQDKDLLFKLLSKHMDKWWD